MTGSHGEQRHMGNVTTDRQAPTELDVDAGANWQNVNKAVKPGHYPTAHSDIVALLLLTHQTAMHNHITQASFTTRAALHQSYTMNRILDRPEKFVSELAQRRIATACKKLVEHLLYKDEAKLTAAIAGSTPFARDFQAIGPKDTQGRSLRDLDLKTRMFKYPCSYLIYSPSFNALPTEARRQIYQQLWDVLNRQDTADDFPHLSLQDRKNILSILRETKKGLPDYWRAE